jgi:gamma-glutamyltranspeptidase/glutathione hydrolase
MKKIQLFLPVFLLVFSCNLPVPMEEKRLEGEIAENGMVVTAHPLASEIGLAVLEKGGNAFDAAIAVKFALAVVYPRAGNVGGGGFMVFRKANGESGTLDFREKAPKKASKDMFLDDEGNPIKDASTFGALAVGVPGSVEGMLKTYDSLGGKLPFKELIQPAIDLAKNGFLLTTLEAEKFNSYQEDFEKANGKECYLLDSTGWELGDSIKHIELAKTLELIRDNGRDGFYAGETAKLLLNQIQQSGGILIQEDLDDYKVVWRKPVLANYKGYKVISMPPPSSGGIALAQLLQGSERFGLTETGHNSAQTAHYMVELERRVYADRATHLGDMDFFEVPVAKLLDKTYLQERFADIESEAKTPSEEIKAGKVAMIESFETTHFSIVDKEGNAVSITTTLNGNYGSKLMVKGAGFFLNNEMDDFSIKPGVSNMFGLVGGKANAIAPEKRMLSSMTPTIVENPDGKLFMVVGTPGGSTIITSVYQSILNVIDHGMNMQESVNAKKFHSQWLPDQVFYEEGAFDSTTISQLQKFGHVLKTTPQLGKIEAILVKSDGTLEGAADITRGDDKAMGY